MTKNYDDFIAALPPSIEPEFVMGSPDEPIRLAVGTIELRRDGQLLGDLEGELTLEWVPKLRIVCIGDSDADLAGLFFDNRPVLLHSPQLGMSAEAFVTHVQVGKRHEIRALLMEARNSRLQDTDQFRFYLVNFPPILGHPVRTGSGPFTTASRDRLRMTAGSLTCTVDRIGRTRQRDSGESKPGYLLTHVAEIRTSGAVIPPSELQQTLDALYWLFAFMRGARTGPVLPSLDSPFAKHWISVAPWTVDEPRRVESWMPECSSANFDSLFAGFLDKWTDVFWNEALRTTIAWYIAANAPSTPNEARISLCQIALEVLASLSGFESGVAHQRIRGLLQDLGIPTQVPPRLQALEAYAAGLGVDAPECLTRIRNRFEHPTAKNRKHAGMK